MDEIIEAAARRIDPTVWEMDAPVPTRQDVEIFHARRQLSISRARAAIAAIMPAIGERFANAVAGERTAVIPAHDETDDWGEVIAHHEQRTETRRWTRLRADDIIRALANTMAAEVGK